MRRLPFVIAIVAAAITPAIADSRHGVDPAFLGIGFGAGQMGGVLVTEVEDGTGAMDAGLQAGDELIRLDGHAIAQDTFGPMIVAHQSGDTVHLEILRVGARFNVDAVLSTRQEILQHRLVGRPAPITELVDVEDHHAVDLSALGGRPAVIAWETHTCEDCDRLVRRVATWAATRGERNHGVRPLALAVTTGDVNMLGTQQRANNLPLAVATPEVFDRFAVSGTDQNRITFMVVDARGQVVLVSPIAVTDDDAETALDDVLAACEQAEHHAARH